MNEEFGTRKLRVGPVVCDRKTDANGSVSQKKLIELMNIRNMYSNAMGRFEESKSDLMTFLSTTDVRDIPLDLSSDIITHLKKCIMVQKKKNEQNRRELMATRSEYSKMETKLKEVIEAINGIEGKTGIKMAREDLTRFRPHSTVRDEISELRSHIDTAQAELKNAELLNRRKMQLVKELTETLDQRKEFHEQLFELRNDYRVAVREFTVISKNVDTMYNEHKSTDLILYSHTREREEANHRLKHLFEDVELLENVKENVENDVSTQIRMIAAQRYRLDCLKNRLEKLSECLVDLGLFEAIQSHINDLTQEPQRFNSFSSPEEVIPSNDKVAVELLDLAQSALEHLEKHLAIRELLVVERDQAVESLESKLASISTKHNDENQERENLKQQFEMKMESERQELEAREQAIREGLDALNVENAQLKRELISIH